MQQMNPVWRARNNVREFHGWRVSLAGSVIWALQSLVWSQGYGNIAVALEQQHHGEGRPNHQDASSI